MICTSFRFIVLSLFANNIYNLIMINAKIYIVGIGPGSLDDITSSAVDIIRTADVIVGYKYYFQFISSYISAKAKCIDSGMKRELYRAEQAFEYAEEGNVVCVISSGDSNIYGMASLIYEMKCKRSSNIEIEVIPGISAFQKAASLLGAPIGHDFCVVSLSDLMTPWEVIEKRIRAAAMADFVTAVYNPKSEGRYWQLYRLKELFLMERDENTPVGYVRQAGRSDQSIHVTTLKDLDPELVDMFTVLIIGNSQSYISQDHKVITPRGYYRMQYDDKVGIGQNIMIQSFRTIEKQLKNKDLPLDYKWALLHAIHTTADFEMERLLYADSDMIKNTYNKFVNGQIKTIVTDVTMVTAGIRKGALERLGINVKCYLQDPDVVNLAKEKGITRTQAGIRKAVQEYPNALFVFGNAPTALIELCDLVRKKKASPSGIIAAPVGFVHVCESKYMVKTFHEIPKLIIEGRKGGSNIAATLVNAILCYNDAEHLWPGRDV